MEHSLTNENEVSCMERMRSIKNCKFDFTLECGHHQFGRSCMGVECLTGLESHESHTTMGGGKYVFYVDTVCAGLNLVGECMHFAKLIVCFQHNIKFRIRKRHYAVFIS